MQYTASYGLGPGNTPRTISTLVTTTSAISLLCAFVNNLVAYFGFTTPQELLSLSWSGLAHWHLWQPLTYFFVQAGGQAGISLSFLFALLFNMYILWIMGASTFERVGKGPFLRFYFITGALTGLCTLLLMPVIGQYSVLAGTAPIILAVLLVWTMLHPNNELLLFFIIPIKARWLLPTFVMLLLLINLSQLNFIELIFNLMGLLIGYFYAAMIWGLETPYNMMRKSDAFFISLGSGIRKLFPVGELEKNPSSEDNRAEIIDFHTGKAVMDDDLFMDKVLEKISKYGEKSLTWNERHRMHKISERKSRRK